MAVAGDYAYVADDDDGGLAVLRVLFRGDINGDGVVNLADHRLWAGSLNGPGVAYPQGCRAADLDGDLDVDLADFAEFQTSFTGDE